MRPTFLKVTTLILVCLGALPGAGSAQVRVEVGPYIGLYAPTASFGSAPFGNPIPLPASSRHGTAALAGGKAVVWFGRSAGLGMQLGTASSRVRTRDEGSREMEQPARVTVGAVQLIVPLQIPSLRGRGHAHLSGGIGQVSRSGEFYEAYDRVKNTAGVLGVGSGFPLAGPAYVTLDVEAYLYSLQLQQPGGMELESGFQTDLLARVGLVLQLGPSSNGGR